MKKKNQITKYHIPSHMRIMRKIQDQLIKNLLTKLRTEKENQKIYEYN